MYKSRKPSELQKEILSSAQKQNTFYKHGKVSPGIIFPPLKMFLAGLLSLQIIKKTT